MTDILDVTQLHVSFPVANGHEFVAVDGVDFSLRRGSTLGLVGESGSGKTVSVMAALGLLPKDSRARVKGSAVFDGVDLMELAPARRRKLLGSAIGVVFQDPMSSLNPVFTVGHQLGEAVRAHRRVGRDVVRRRVYEVLELVGISAPDLRTKQYPHELSGGLRQRVMIAQALINEPKLLIADEPTTALDVTIQAQVLDVISTAARETGASTLLITHDLGVVRDMSEDVVVMYGGRVMERGPVEDVFEKTVHPYTIGLLRSLPRLGPSRYRLQPIKGDPGSGPRGGDQCPFHDRCELSRDRGPCRSVRPSLVEVNDLGHAVACHFRDESDEYRNTTPDIVDVDVVAKKRGAPAIVVEGVSKVFVERDWMGRAVSSLFAVQEVSFEVPSGQTLAIVGESGSGKSTLARMLLNLLNPSSGKVTYPGFKGSAISGHVEKEFRKWIQVVFQDPYSALDPRMTVQDIVEAPLKLHGIGGGRKPRERMHRLLREVGLPVQFAARYPHQLSGGQRQRVGIARALALDPEVVVLDEPVSALDVSVQAQVLNLLADLQESHGLTYVLISHDLSVVGHMADEIAVMYMGKIVELGSRDAVLYSPMHPYTQGLLSAIPGRSESQSVSIRGELPDPTVQMRGCAFVSRCPFASEVCRAEEPKLLPGEGGQFVACHHAVARDILGAGAVSAGTKSEGMN